MTNTINETAVIDVTELANSGKLFFTADQHFGHENIIKFCNRPFDDVVNMDAALVENWNKVISHDCTVFHLGDFTLMDGANAAQYFGALNGRIYITGVPWHHDKRWLKYSNPPYRTYDEYPVEILPPECILEIYGLHSKKWPLTIHLSHYPIGDWDRKYHGGWHLHGHSHGQYLGDNHKTGELCWDVGVDGAGVNYTPVSFGGILEWAYECGWGQSND